VVLRCAGSVGTGFFVAPDLVLTNAHVLCPGGEEIRAVFADGREFTGRPVESDSWLDLGLVRVPGTGASPLPLGDATVLRTGDEVVFVGTPQGLEFTVHEGIVSHTGRNLLGVAFLQIDANVNSGNSGGPLFDQQGRVVGIVSAKLEQAEGLGFVLPINYAYEGQSPFLSRPSPAPDSESWRGLLAQVEEEDRRDAQRMAAAASHSALLGVSPVPGRGLAAVVVRLSHGEPGPEPVSFTFRKAQRPVCSVAATVERWRRVEPETGGEAARYLQWMEKHGIYKDLYQGLAMVSLEGCPAGEIADTEIALDGE
jgi:serine protease Do